MKFHKNLLKISKKLTIKVKDIHSLENEVATDGEIDRVQLNLKIMLSNIIA